MSIYVGNNIHDGVVIGKQLAVYDWLGKVYVQYHTRQMVDIWLPTPTPRVRTDRHTQATGIEINRNNAIGSVIYATRSHTATMRAILWLGGVVESTNDVAYVRWDRDRCAIRWSMHGDVVRRWCYIAGVDSEPLQTAEVMSGLRLLPSGGELRRY